MIVQINSLGCYYALYYVVQGGVCTTLGSIWRFIWDLYKKNYNPHENHVDDCVIRAIATVTGKDWNDIYLDLAIEGYIEKDMPNGNILWGTYLLSHGFTKHSLPDTCPLCYTVRQFVKDYPYGKYILGDGSHVIAVVDGYYIDTYRENDE